VVFLVLGLIHIELADARKGKKGKKKPNKGKGKGKRPGKRPKPTKGPEVLFGRFTDGADCPCWFDLTRSDCGCCKNNGVQCGDPMGAWCQNPKFKHQGCPGIKEHKYTLSQTGHPCHWDHSNRNCAFCAAKRMTYQCGNATISSPDSGDNHCVSEATGTASNCDAGRFVPDCRRMGRGICDINAKCEKTRKKLDQTHLWACQCQPGWRNTAPMPGRGGDGTGLTCVDDDGNFSQDPALTATMELVVTNDFYVFPADSSEFPTGPSADNMFSQMKDWLNGGGGCSAAQACNVTTFA